MKKKQSMTQFKLNKLTKVIRKSSGDIQRSITKIAIKSGWEAKGYSSLKEYYEKDLNDTELGYYAINRHKNIGITVYNLAGQKYVGRYKGDAIMPLVKLDEKQQKKAWSKLQKKCGKEEIPPKWLNKKRVLAALEALKFIPTSKIETSIETTEVKDDDKYSFGEDSIDEDDQPADLDNQKRPSNKDDDEATDNSSFQANVKTAHESEAELSTHDSIEQKFHSHLNHKFKGDKYFSRRITSCIEETFSEKCILTICKHLLESMEYEQQRVVFKYLKARR